MNALLAHMGMNWRLHLRNRLALIYGFLFPLLFLGVFQVLYRHEAVPLVRHLGQLLTIGILGGACFGLPTTLVSERERGLWRRYRLTPASPVMLVAGVAGVRIILLVCAGCLQYVAARLMGMPPTANAGVLLTAFLLASFAFIGLGLVIAMTADNVPAVQALGQCVFLPMLVIGGVAVPLESLPDWTQRVSGYFPGRYAVEALQAAATGSRAEDFNYLALAITGLSGVLAATRLFRWEARDAAPKRRGWALLALFPCLLFGALMQPLPKPAISLPTTSSPWTRLTARDVAQLPDTLPPDSGVVTPIALAGEIPDEVTAEQLRGFRERLADWAAPRDRDPVQAVQDILCVAAVADLSQQPVERYLPTILLEYLLATHDRADLVQLLTWIALHPEAGTVVDDLTSLGISGPMADEFEIRYRMQVYAIKFVARLRKQID